MTESTYKTFPSILRPNIDCSNQKLKVIRDTTFEPLKFFETFNDYFSLKANSPASIITPSFLNLIEKTCRLLLILSNV